MTLSPVILSKRELQGKERNSFFFFLCPLKVLGTLHKQREAVWWNMVPKGTHHFSCSRVPTNKCVPCRPPIVTRSRDGHPKLHTGAGSGCLSPSWCFPSHRRLPHCCVLFTSNNWCAIRSYYSHSKWKLIITMCICFSQEPRRLSFFLLPSLVPCPTAHLFLWIRHE